MFIKNRYIFITFLILVFVFDGHTKKASCLTCNFPMSKESGQSGQSSPCEDLYGAACLNADGKSKHNNFMTELDADSSKNIKEVQLKTVQSMGYKDLGEAIKAKLKEEGILINESVDPNIFEQLATSGYGHQNNDSLTEIYPDVVACKKESKELNEIKIHEMSDLSELNALNKKFESLLLKQREKSVNLHVRDIPNFIAQHVGAKCTIMNSSAHIYKPEENQEIMKACDKSSFLKRQAIDLYRAEGSPEYNQQAEKFVKENLLPELQPSTSDIQSQINALPQSQKDVLNARNKVQKLNQALIIQCNLNADLAVSASRKVAKDFMLTIAKSKTTVETLIDTVYSKDREKSQKHYLKLHALISKISHVFW